MPYIQKIEKNEKPWKEKRYSEKQNVIIGKKCQNLEEWKNLSIRQKICSSLEFFNFVMGQKLCRNIAYHIPLSTFSVVSLLVLGLFKLIRNIPLYCSSSEKLRNHLGKEKLLIFFFWQPYVITYTVFGSKSIAFPHQCGNVNLCWICIWEFILHEID